MTTRLKERASERGFTLIELLIVIVILGILAAIVVFSVGGITDRGSRSACQANVETVNIASEAYRTQNAAYAPTIPALQTAGFLKTIPGAVAVDGLSFTVTNPGGTPYTVSYAAATGLATSTCPAGSGGGGGGGTTTTTSAACAFAGFTPASVTVSGTGTISAGTATATFTGNCAAITAVQLEIDKNDSGGYGGGEDHGNMAGGPNVWTDALTTTDWNPNQTVNVRLTVTGGTLGQFVTTMTTVGPCALASFTPDPIDVTNGGGTTQSLVGSPTATATFASSCTGITGVVLSLDKNADGDYNDTGEVHPAMTGGPLVWTVAITNNSNWDHDEDINARLVVTGGGLGTINFSVETD